LIMENNGIKEVLGQFQVYGDFVSAELFGSGHINDTYAASCCQGGAIVRYVLQRVNADIFPDMPELMENIVRVTEHIGQKLLSQGCEDISRRVLTVIRTNDDNSYYKDNKGNFWRCFVLIENARTYDVMPSLEYAYEAARAFGDFQKLLVDLPSPPLNVIIKDFHNGRKRYKDFLEVLKADAHNRAAGAKDEIDFLNENAGIFDVLHNLAEQNKIPLRITHNDTKINNVMFDKETGKGICIIDLDTVMPGLSLYDFGDIVRTTIGPAGEDEQDLSKVFAEMPRFEAIVRGYLSSAGEFLNEYERDNLILGGKYITLMIGARFLTDYLDGDRYYKIHRDGHNLDRCRTQFKLVRSMTDQHEQMSSLVEKLTRETDWQ